jgi:diguanylate cyclase (GGDEF)-like protein
MTVSPAVRQALQALGVSNEPMSPAVQAALEALAQEVAHQRGLNAQLKRTLAEVEQLADTDPLTRVYNRRAFNRELARHLAYAKRYAVNTALIFIDLDGFKAINDALGHPAGDKVLRAVGRLLLAQVRGSDVVGRLGGDEFAIILPHAEPEGALYKAKQLSEAVGSAVDAALEGAPIPEPLREGFGGSFGLALFQHGDTADTLIARADEAMYLAKQAKGRARR